MIGHAPRRIVALVLLGFMLGSPMAAAQAVSGSVIARSLELEGGAIQQGSLMFFHVGNGLAPDREVDLRVAGQRIEGSQYEASGYEASAGSSRPSTMRLADSVVGNPGTPFSGNQAVLSTLGSQTGYLMNLYVTHATAFRSALPEGSQTVLQQPQLDRGGIHEPPNSAGAISIPYAPDLSGGGQSYWSTKTAETPHVVTHAVGSADLHLQGAFTLEVMGVDFRLKGEGVDKELKSGTERAPLAPGAPDTVQAIKQTFLRIVVTDGSLDLTVKGIESLQWSGPTVETTTHGISLNDATGSILQSDGQQQRLTGSTYHLDGRYQIQSNPSQQGLQLGMTGLDENGQPLAPSTTGLRQEVPAVTWLFALAAVAVASAAALYFAVRHRHVPTMHDVESALESGHFRRAARDASRMLRLRPGFEDALISRSIALTKMGQNQRAVSEIRAHFASREPSDGVLHYVLGLALKEVGQPQEAQLAWQEAVRRTPSLLPQVQPYLSGQQGSSTASGVTPLVDGTAYA